jgi:hypothetical protein
VEERQVDHAQLDRAALWEGRCRGVRSTVCTICDSRYVRPFSASGLLASGCPVALTAAEVRPS